MGLIGNSYGEFDKNWAERQVRLYKKLDDMSFCGSCYRSSTTFYENCDNCQVDKGPLWLTSLGWYCTRCLNQWTVATMWSLEHEFGS